MLNYTSPTTFRLNKLEDSYSTFDDGLLFRFPHANYSHLTYYCRTSTPLLDTCNVKLFKFGQFTDNANENGENRKWMPPFNRSETVLFARFGYHRYFKVNYNVDSMLHTRQIADRWYKFDYLFSFEDQEISVFIDDKHNTT